MVVGIKKYEKTEMKIKLTKWELNLFYAAGQRPKLIYINNISANAFYFIYCQ